MINFADLDLANKRVLIREDFNVPINNQHVTSTKRIEAALPTIAHALKQNSCVMLMSHLGRPKEGEYDEHFSLQPVQNVLAQYLKQPVRFLKNWVDKNIDVQPGEVVLFENVRFLPGEKQNDSNLSKKIAAHCDVFVMDAFATAHRKAASTYGVAQFAPVACAGPLLITELNALAKIMEKPVRPLLAIVGGAKVSTKLAVLETLLQKVDQLIVGGGIANTFLAAQGVTVGKSLYEKEFIPQAKKLLAIAKELEVDIPLPTDVVVADSFSENAAAKVKNIRELTEEDMILDIGPETSKQFTQIIHNARTILWNGPVGVFEWEKFAQGTKAIAEAIAKGGAFSVAGGGDTIAAIEKFKVEQQISYISTGGGAFLEFIEGKKLPAVEVLERYEKN